MGWFQRKSLIKRSSLQIKEHFLRNLSKLDFPITASKLFNRFYGRRLMSEFKDNYETALRHQKEFWSGSLKEGPLVTIWLPDDTPQDERWSLAAEETRLKNKAHLADDTVPTVEVNTGSHTFVALLGSHIQESSGTQWVEPCLSDISQFQKIKRETDSPLYKMIMDHISIAGASSADKYPVRTLTTPGIADIIDGLAGTENILMSFIDDPEHVHGLCQHVGKLWSEVMEDVFSRVPLFQGGSSAGLAWMPGKAAYLSADLMVMCSAAQFNTFIAPVENKILEDFDSALYHVHSTGLRVIDAVLEMEKVKGIEISHDPNGPSIPEMGKILKKITETKKLLLTGWSRAFTDDELAWLKANIDRNKLFLFAQGGTVENGNRVVEKLKKALS
jgi:hypothetical protein